MKRLLAPVFVFIVGGTLLILAIPRTIAAFVVIPGKPILHKIQTLEKVPTKDIQFLIKTQKSGLAWNNSGRMQTDIGLSQLLLADTFDQKDPRRKEIIGKAIDSLKVGLSKAPGNPFAWTRLAFALAFRDGISRESILALVMGVELAPFEPRLAVARMSFGFAAWKQLKVNEREIIYDQVRDLWTTWPHYKEVINYAVETGHVNFIRAALIPIPKELNKFERLFKKVSKNS